MDEKQEQAIRTAIQRHEEVIEALVARKGQRYCNQVTTFLACAKMLNTLYHPSQEDHKGFCYMLMECMGYITPDQIQPFMRDVDIIRRAQEYKV